MKISGYLVLAVAILALAGCGRKSTLPSTTGAETAPTGAESSGADTAGAQAGNLPGGGFGTGAGANAPQQRVIYFDFDSSEIRPEFVDVVASHARALAGNASVKVRLEGHTDERGSREYNVGLGERRSQTVRRALLLQGVNESQVSTVSYGEERPAQAGSAEESWSRNRRVEIVYLN